MILQLSVGFIVEIWLLTFRSWKFAAVRFLEGFLKHYLLTEGSLLLLLFPVYKGEKKVWWEFSVLSSATKMGRETWDPAFNSKSLTLPSCEWRSRKTAPGFSSKLKLNSVLLNKIKSLLIVIRDNGLSFGNSLVPHQRCWNTGMLIVLGIKSPQIQWNTLDIMTWACEAFTNIVFIYHNQGIPVMHLVSKPLLKNFWGSQAVMKR